MLTAEQKAIRSTGIGGSEIAALVGLNPWMRPIDVWQRKLGLVEDAGGFHIERGTHLEPALIRWYETRTGRRTTEAGTLRHPKYPHVLATPDALVIDGDQRTLETKAPGWRSADDWGEPGTDQVPAYYVPQLMFEAACAGMQIADAAALIDEDLAIYTVPFDQELFEFLADAAERFWRDHIEAQTPPPIEPSKSYADFIDRRFPRSRGPMIERSAEADALAERLRIARRDRVAAEKAEEAVILEIKAILGEAEGVDTELGRITWKSAAGSPRWKAIAEELGASPDLIAKHTPAEGGRRFNVPRSWAKEA